MPRTHHETPVLDQPPEPEPQVYYYPPPAPPRARRSPGLFGPFLVGLFGTLGGLVAWMVVIAVVLFGLVIGGLAAGGWVLNHLPDPPPTTTTTVP